VEGAPPNEEPLVRLVFPPADSVVNGGALLIAELVASFPRDKVRNVAFDYSTDGAKYQPVTGVAPAGGPEFAALWDTGSLPGGEYFLRVTLNRKGGRPSIDTIRVQVNEPPIEGTSAELVSLLTVRFDASLSHDPDGTIDLYKWDFGDGTTVEGSGATVEHTFPSTDTFPISVTVEDNLGGAATGHYLLTFPQSYYEPIDFRRKEYCGCKKMTIKDKDTVEGPTGFEFDGLSSGVTAQGEATKLGAYNDGKAGDQLDLSEPTITVNSRFEVIADLEDDSNPQLCTEGQRAKATDKQGRGTPQQGVEFPHIGKKSFTDPRYDSGSAPDDPYTDRPPDNPRKTEKALCGYDDDDWCDDNYHGGGGPDGSGRPQGPPNKHKAYDGQKRIVWVDAPGFVRLETGKVQPDGLSLKAKFEAKVASGIGAAGGTCACSWEVLIEVDNTGKVLNNKVLNASCTP
jgi:hypothetical protein